MAKKITEEVKKIKKGNNQKKQEVNKDSIFPILGIIIALIVASVFFYTDTANVIKHYIEDKEELNLVLNSIKIVACNFVGTNAILLLIEWVLYKYNHKKILFALVICISAFAICTLDYLLIRTLLTPFIVGLFYSAKLLRKES